jgi:hypothetical protein
LKHIQLLVDYMGIFGTTGFQPLERVGILMMVGNNILWVLALGLPSGNLT